MEALGNGTRGAKSGERRILVAGFGNVLLRDGGVGIHAIREMQKMNNTEILVSEIGTAVRDAHHLFAWADRVLAIDAMQARGTPGMIYSLTLRSGNGYGIQGSLHQPAFIEAVRRLPPEGQPEITILGVEPEVIGYGLDLSPAVLRSIPDLVRIAVEIIDCWKARTERVRR
ncbi:MAG: hydrogenase maturation protease [Alphaproteobacteria bacterium]|uniref:Hydrogenase maturation protease n=1 Tax=Candidatus Nitrobium versatile TaxID=2884831 RepID=A0A953J2B7_9BACT|nr:hydrogenase maturation protease [Candidatus Nitrobium versatile]